MNQPDLARVNVIVMFLYPSNLNPHRHACQDFWALPLVNPSSFIVDQRRLRLEMLIMVNQWPFDSKLIVNQWLTDGQLIVHERFNDG